MKTICGINKIRKFRKPVVALGVFDGVHIGHRHILKAAVEKARRINGTSVVLTFWPHPQKEESLYSLEHRLRLIRELGTDVCIVINFNRRFAGISAENFIKNILVRKAGADYIYVGKNFKFGKKTQGDFKLLRKLSPLYNFKLKAFDVIKINNQPISSTYIRKLIKKGNLKAAEKLLMRPVSVLGTVIKGTSLAARLGFPTANINPHHEVLPPCGVYAVKIIFNKKKINGICNIGIKPTFLRQKAKGKRHKAKTHIEAHMFNFKQNIYGRYLEIQFVKKIRDEKRFASSRALVKQIKKDIIYSKTLFSLP
jgi:riboflavin kinase/FMN adenylyltransferase